MTALTNRSNSQELGQAGRAGLLGVFLLLAFVAGCAKLDPASVERARTSVQNAEKDPDIDQNQSIHMREAQRHLELAEKKLDENKHQELVDHQAYLAETHATIAMTESAAKRDLAAAPDLLEQAREATADTGRVVEEAVRRAEALEAEQTERGLVLTLDGVLFEFDSAELKAGAQVSVARVAGFLIALENREVLVEGHTDNVGKDDYNLQLSERRAESVREALIANRVAGWRIEADGFGSEFPVASNDTDEGRQQNRRVELIVLDPGKSAAQARRKR